MTAAAGRGLIDLVGDGSGERAHGSLPRHSRDLRPGRSERLLGALTVDYLRGQRVIDRRKLPCPLRDSLLKLFIQLLYFLLRLLQLWGLDELPCAFALDGGELMRPRHVQCAAGGERAGAEHQHGLIAQGSVELLLIGAEVVPVLGLIQKALPLTRIPS